MLTLMFSMNIASNGAALTPEQWRTLRRRFPDHGGVLTQLRFHRALWRLRQFEHYQYTLSQRLCGRPEGELRVRVSAGRVENVYCLNRAQAIAPPPHVGAVEDYFERAELALTKAPESVCAYFHPLHGYPLSLSFSALAQGDQELRQLA